MKEGRSTFKILTGKPTGKTPLGRPRRRWENDIRMDLEEIGINAGNWVHSAQDLKENVYVRMLPSDHEVLGSIPDSAVGFSSSGELFN